MTDKELGMMEELIKAESLCAKKLEVWKDDVRDPELRRICDEAIRDCQQHVDMMLRELRA